MASPRQSWPRATDEKNQIFLGALKKAWESGFNSGARLPDDSEMSDARDKMMSEIEWWSFDLRPEKPKVEKKAKGGGGDNPQPRKSSGAWVDNPELANKPFNPEFCNCRKWNDGYGGQCNRDVFDDGLCKLHKNQLDKIIQNGGSDLSHGRFNEPRPVMCLAKPEKEHKHPWKDLIDDDDSDKKKKEKKEKKKEKKEKKKEKKEKKEKKKVVEEVAVEPEVDEVAEDPKVEEVTEEPKVEEVAEDPKVEEVTEEPKVEEVTEEPKVEEVAVEPKVEEVAVEPKVEEVTEEPKVEEVAVEPKVETEDEDATQDLDSDESSLVEVEWKGIRYLHDLTRNQIIDSEDGEILGDTVLDDDGEIIKVVFKGDEDSSEEEDSDDEDSDESDSE